MTAIGSILAFANWRDPHLTVSINGCQSRPETPDNSQCKSRRCTKKIRTCNLATEIVALSRLDQLARETPARLEASLPEKMMTANISTPAKAMSEEMATIGSIAMFPESSR